MSTFFYRIDSVGKNIFIHTFFFTKSLSKKKYYRLNNFLTKRLSKRISNWASKKSSDLTWSKIKYPISHFFVRPIVLNIYKSIVLFFVQVNKQQRKHFGHVIFLPTERTTKEQNDYQKKLCKIVPLNALNSYFKEQKKR